jgi:hypothetical protein
VRTSLRGLGLDRERHLARQHAPQHGLVGGLGRIVRALALQRVVERLAEDPLDAHARGRAAVVEVLRLDEARRVVARARLRTDRAAQHRVAAHEPRLERRRAAGLEHDPRPPTTSKSAGTASAVVTPLRERAVPFVREEVERVRDRRARRDLARLLDRDVARVDLDREVRSGPASRPRTRARRRRLRRRRGDLAVRDGDAAFSMGAPRTV